MSAQEMRDGGYYELFGAIYRFLQNSSGTNDWNAIVSDADKLCARYNGTALGSLSNELTLCVVNELERRGKST